MKSDVDTVHQMCGTNRVIRRFLRWPIIIFCVLLNINDIYSYVFMKVRTLADIHPAKAYYYYFLIVLRTSSPRFTDVKPNLWIISEN